MSCGSCKCPELKGYITKEENDQIVRLFFHAKGEFRCESPTLLFVHGLGTDHAVWSCQQDLFCPYYPTLSIDLRGFGRSDKPATSDYSYAMFAEDIKYMLDQLHVRSVIFIGAGLGASLGIFFSALYPAYVEALSMSGANPLFAAQNAAAWECVEFTFAELAQIWAAIALDYNDFLKVRARALFPSSCSDVHTLRCYSYKTSRLTPPSIAARIYGQNNPASFVYTSLFIQVDKVAHEEIPLLVQVGQHSSDAARCAAGWLFSHLTLGHPTFHIYELSGDYANATEVNRYNNVLCKWLSRPCCDRKCQTCTVSAPQFHLPDVNPPEEEDY